MKVKSTVILSLVGIGLMFTATKGAWAIDCNAPENRTLCQRRCTDAMAAIAKLRKFPQTPETERAISKLGQLVVTYCPKITTRTTTRAITTPLITSSLAKPTINVAVTATPSGVNNQGEPAETKITAGTASPTETMGTKSEKDNKVDQTKIWGRIFSIVIRWFGRK
jgi:hypothetical protein